MNTNENVAEMVENPRMALFKMAIPTFVSFGCILLNLFFDSIWVSGLGNVEVSVVGITSFIFNLLIIIGTGIGTTVNVSLSKSIAAKDIEESNSLIKNILLVILGLSILIPLIVLPFLDKILALFCTNQIFDASYSYLSILVCFIGFFFVLDILPFLLRLQGYIKIPIVIIVITSGINMVLDPIFIYSFNWGIKGAAMATVCSVIIGSIILFAVLLIKRNEYISIGEYNYNRKRDLKVLKKNIRIGVPVILQSALTTFFSILINNFFLYEGLIYITAYSFANKLLAFALLPLNAFSSAMISVIGFLIGAKHWDDITPNLKYAFFVVEVITIIPSIFAFFGSDFLSYVLYQTKDMLVINQISLSIKFFAILNIVQNACLLVDAMFISIEKPEKSFYLLLIGTVLTFGAMYVMEYWLHIVNSVYYVLIVVSIVQIVIYYYMFRKDLNEFLDRKRNEKEINEDAELD